MRILNVTDQEYKDHLSKKNSHLDTSYLHEIQRGDPIVLNVLSTGLTYMGIVENIDFSNSYFQRIYLSLNCN